MLEFLTKFASNYAVAVVSQFAALTVLWLIFWKWIGPRMPAARIQPKSNTGGKQMRREIKNGLLVLAFQMVITTGLITYMGGNEMQSPASMVMSPGWIAWSIISIPIVLIISDAWFYFMHRILHSKAIYKYIHNEHHKSLDTTPFTVLSFHFIEPMLLTLWVIPVVLFMPVHIITFGFVQAYGFFDNVKAHLGYEFFPGWFNRGAFSWLSTSTYHNMHHKHYNGNYSLHFRFWDRVLGTELPTYNAEFDAIAARRKEARDAKRALAQKAA